MTETRSTCPYCGVGCGVIIESAGDAITGVRGDPDHPANFGRLCSKGSTLHLTATREVTLQTRLLQPMQRAARGATPQPIGWDAALELAADRFAATIAAHGADAVGFYISGQLLTEDYYVFNKLAKGLVGTNNVDSNSRLCMSSAVAGYKMTLGADAPPCCYDDIAHASTLFIAGSNTAYAHPIVFRRIEDARRANPALKIVVVDPRRTETAASADLHLAIAPGTDVALFNGLLHVMLWEGWTDAAYIAAHTSGFDALKARVRDFAPKDVARLCGIDEADLVQAARWFANIDATQPAGRAPTLSMYCQGLNQSTSGSLKNAALINLHLATAQIGRPGAGPFSLTGQPNAMGGREVGAMANLLSGHRDLADARDRDEVARLWGVVDVPSTPGLSAVEMFEAAADGALHALWIACTNPAQSMPDQATVRRALERCEFVVVQEAFATTATCGYADLLLPATTWGEKSGTVTNSERRISRVRAAVAAPGAARDDWAIAADFARRLEARLRASGGSRAVVERSLFEHASAEAIWNEHRETTRGRDLDIGGLDYARLEREPAQWPWPAGAGAGRSRLYADGIYPTADGRARFVDAAYEPPAERRDARFPFVLNTGRLRDQWHGMSRTGTVARLFGHVPEPAVEMNPSDMQRLRLADGDLVTVTSRRGAITLAAQASVAQAPAQAFIAMHWGDEFLSGAAGGPAETRAPGGAADARPGRAAGVNALTQPAFCARSKQPELKHAAVRIARADLPWRLLALAWLPAERALAVREALRPLLGELAFATCVPFGRERSGVLFRAAALAPPPATLVERMEALLDLRADSAPASRPRLHYSDPRRGQHRTIRLSGAGAGTRVDGFLIAGDISAEAWLRPLLQQELPAAAHGRALLSAGATPPQPVVARGRQVCSCFDVSEDAVVACVARVPGPPAVRLAALQGELKCGTNCGSCLPALRALVDAPAAQHVEGASVAA
ncbi:molybdopterin-dependent oxidoreductase [Piscinibacter koreensis]|uniref:Molybdopterin-dependent oxidoreductase n=1 Tax=Piscinibacter koreensis TaxID=2742824 RepID=A0A7Y6TY55_9BURK|nr:molybdopterin-dependent oxidoreductase [Schlegelella koreensis]